MMKLEEIFEADCEDCKAKSMAYTTVVAWEEGMLSLRGVDIMLTRLEGRGYDVSKYRGYIQHKVFLKGEQDGDGKL